MSGDVIEALARVLLAGVLGAVIGLDRELHGKPAGLRTNLLVAAAAAVFADVSINGFAVVGGYDPSRVAAGVVSGIGFLGAGAIFGAGGRPRGLTTAAALWASAAVGLSVGVGRWPVAVLLVGIGVAALMALRPLERRVLSGRRRAHRNLYVVVGRAEQANQVQSHLREAQVEVREIEFAELGDQVGIDLVISGRQGDVEAALEQLHQVEGVLFASDEHGTTELNGD